MYFFLVWYENCAHEKAFDVLLILELRGAANVILSLAKMKKKKKMDLLNILTLVWHSFSVFYICANVVVSCSSSSFVIDGIFAWICCCKKKKKKNKINMVAAAVEEEEYELWHPNFTVCEQTIYDKEKNEIVCVCVWKR